MKLCILTATPGWGGTELHTLGLAETLGRRGHEVLIVQLGHEIYERYSTLERRRSSRTRLVRVEIARPLIDLGLLEWCRILGRLDANICIFAKNQLMHGTLRLELAARICFSRYITIEHQLCEIMPPKSSKRHFGGLVRGVGLWWFWGLLSRFLRCLPPHRVICVSDAIRNRLTQYYRFPPRKVTTIHNGIDPLQFRRDEEARRVVRNEWGVPENALVFGAVGRLSMEKGYQIALQALRELTAALPEREMRLVLVGEGPLQGSIKIAAKEQGLEERVILPGFTNQPWNAYAGFDVFIMPSQNEGLPLALLEAMACGCCPIAMGVGGIPEVIIDSTLGWLVQSNDRAGFLAAMTAAAQSDTDTLAQMGRRARGHIVSRFDAENQYSALAHLVEMECGESPHRSKENDLARWLIRRHPR